MIVKIIEKGAILRLRETEMVIDKIEELDNELLLHSSSKQLIKIPLDDILYIAPILIIKRKE